jgi:hypothetical protein
MLKSCSPIWNATLHPSRRSIQADMIGACRSSGDASPSQTLSSDLVVVAANAIPGTEGHAPDWCYTPAHRRYFFDLPAPRPAYQVALAAEQCARMSVPHLARLRITAMRSLSSGSESELSLSRCFRQTGRLAFITFDPRPSCPLLR